MNKSGERLQHQTREHWWSRRCVDRLREERKLPLLLSRGNGCSGVERRRISWREVWKTQANIKATYEVLPTSMNRQQLYFEDPTYALCSNPPTLKHIMTGCKTSLTQGRYTWRHSQILKILASALESKCSMTNSQPPRASNLPKATLFVREGQKTPKNPSTKSGQLCLACDSKMLADIGQQLIFLPESALTNVRPDLILWLPSLKMVYIIELTLCCCCVF